MDEEIEEEIEEKIEELDSVYAAPPPSRSRAVSQSLERTKNAKLGISFSIP